MEIIHFDTDSFECQAYTQLPEYKHLVGKPVVVANSSGVITSVSTEAKALGIDKTKKSGKTAYQVEREHPWINVITIPDRFGKSDNSTARDGLLRIREAAKDYQATYGSGHLILECPLKDEFFCDVTQMVSVNMNTILGPDDIDGMNIYLETYRLYHGYPLAHRLGNVYTSARLGPNNYQELRLLIAAHIAQYIIDFILNRTRFKMSAGVGTNKLMAKLATDLHKPNGITILTKQGLSRMAEDIAFEKLPGLGGDNGKRIKSWSGFGKNALFSIENLRYLVEQPAFKAKFGLEYTNWLRDCAYGDSEEQVRQITLDSAISSSKTFRVRLSDMDIWKFAGFLARDLLEKLEKQGLALERRIATKVKFQIAFCYGGHGGGRIHRSSATVETGALDIPLAQYQDTDSDSIADAALEVIQEERGIDLSSIFVKEMRFTGQFGEDDFIDEELESELWDFILG